MSKSNSLENSILLLLFNGTTIADLAENDTSSPLTVLYVSLHTADPGEAGTQLTNECTYGSYARVAINRNSGGWTVTNNSVSPVASISFPQAASGTETATHGAIGTTTTGNAGVILYSGTLSPNISITTGVTPIITTSSTITED
jgi:hypothetical protein